MLDSSQSYLCNAKHCQLQAVVMFCVVILLHKNRSPFFVVGAGEKHQNGTKSAFSSTKSLGNLNRQDSHYINMKQKIRFMVTFK